MDLEQTLRDAISAKVPLSLSYEGDGIESRTVHPHVLFRTSTGKICVDSYQVAGPTSSGGPLPSWRPFDLSKIVQVESLDGTFDIAPGLNLGSPRYANGLLAHV